MFTLKYVLSNIDMTPLMIFMGLMALAEIQRGRCVSLILYLCVIVLEQADHFTSLINDTNETVENFLIMKVIEKRPFKYQDESLLYISTWQEIIADINLQVRTRYNNKYYHLGNIEVAKDRFFYIMNKFSLRTTKESFMVNFTDWEKTLLIARNMYEEDSCNEKICDEKY
ncbi:unnamed protein product [Debaryomyces tyrocola]|nr:unnamed protein product [Debaryomyces tyrocola]